MRWIHLCFGFLWFVYAGQLVVNAKETDPVISQYDQTTIISEQDHYDGRSQLLLGLRIKLKPGWHTYWKNPGDAGEPAEITLQVNGKEQEHKADILWPSPTALSENGLMSYVYKNDVVLPFKLDLSKEDQSNPIHLLIKSKWLVCADVCIPEQGEFTLDLPKGNNVPAQEAPLLQAALNKQPQKSKWNFHISPSGFLWAKSDHIDSKKINKIWFMPEKSGWMDQVAKQALAIQQDLVTLKLSLLDNKPVTQSVSGVLTIEDTRHQVNYFQLNASVMDLPIIPKHQNYQLFILIGSAFLGGILLNLMPCVFPVIAMKLLSLSRLGQEHVRSRYKSSFAYTIGILCCFIGMAIMFSGLRWMGSQMGWGFQFQSVAFVILLCWLLFVIALNFLGVFQIQFSFGYVSKSLNPSSYYSDFFTGLLAVLVATPCTAPFMGVAIAGALNASLWVSILIFVGMGVGLALPYILFACIPSFARILPHPGAWMDILKQFLAFPLLLSCLWLIWVVYQHQKPLLLLLLLLGIIGLGFIGWLVGLNQHLKMQGIYRCFRWFINGVTFIVCILIGISFIIFVRDDGVVKRISLKDGAIPFSEQKLEQLRQEHQPIFVNMTAAWCLTCMVNDKVALSSDKVQTAFKKYHITYMVGDWTQYDQSIGDFLKAHGREGVPLYIYYPAEGKERILPQILTPQSVMNYLSH